MTRALINGVERDCLSLDDRGLRYGDGLFETVAIRGGRLQYWEKHWARLRRGAERLALSVPPELEREARWLCDGEQEGVLRMTLTRGTGGTGYARDESMAPTRVVQFWPPRARPAEWARTGVRTRLCRTRLSPSPLLAGIKHLNRLEQVMARAEWDDEFAEGLMSDDRNELIEGTMTNVFLVRLGKLATPDLARCGVEGVMREVVLETARRMRVPTVVTRLTMNDLSMADEVFLTNSLVGIWPVREIDRRETGHDTLCYSAYEMTLQMQEAVIDE